MASRFEVAVLFSAAIMMQMIIIINTLLAVINSRLSVCVCLLAEWQRQITGGCKILNILHTLRSIQ